MPIFISVLCTSLYLMLHVHYLPVFISVLFVICSRTIALWANFIVGCINLENVMSPVRCPAIIWTNAGLSLIKPLLHIGGFCRRSAAVPKPWMNAVERHKAQTQPWANATKRHWAPIAAVAVRKFWNVQNFRRRAPVKYLSVMECSRASSIVLDCR